MKTITAIVDGINNKELKFDLQNDGWYINKEYDLSISPLLDSCIIEPYNSSGYVLPQEVPGFKILNIENLMLDVYEKMSKGKTLSPEFNKVLSENILDLF